MNQEAVDSAIKNLHQLQIPEQPSNAFDLREAVSSDATSFVKFNTARILRGRGDELPVSA